MIAKTESYNRLKSVITETFNFIIIASHAIPNLKKTIRYIDDEKEGFKSYKKIVEEKEINLNYKLAKTDNIGFGDININDLKRILKTSNGNNQDKTNTPYNLSKYILISSFSFFENYIQSIIQEFIDFQESFNSTFLTINTSVRAKRYSNEYIYKCLEKYSNEKQINSLVKKISAPYLKSKDQQYKKYSEKLKKLEDYLFPSEILSNTGIRFLIENLKERNELYKFELSKAVDIPKILTSIFYLNCEKTLPDFFVNIERKDGDISIKEGFNNIREIRNKVAHGENPNLTLNQVIKYNYFLKKFASIVDKHFINHYFVIEKFV